MISLIVLNYNDYVTTSQFVRKVSHIEKIDNIVIVDNYSTDDSFKYLKELCCDKVDVITTQENKGYASGNNFGAFYAIKKNNPKYIIIANPDIEVNNEVIEYMFNFAQETDNLGTVTCLMKCSSGISLPVASKLPTYIDCVLENLIILRRLIGNSLEYDANYIKNPIVNVDVLPGSFFMIEASIFKEIGGFDDRTFLYYEENILAYRLKQLKRENYLLTEKSYLHNHSITINKNINSVKKRLEIAFESRLFYCKEYLKCNKFQILILECFFKIGLNDYLWAQKIIGKNGGEKSK